MAHATFFPGTPPEEAALRAALAHGCACHGGQRCAPHRWLDDQLMLKRLIFYRRRHLALRRGEWLTAPQWSADQAG